MFTTPQLNILLNNWMEFLVSEHALLHTWIMSKKNTKQSLKFNKGTLTLPHSYATPPKNRHTHTHTCTHKQTFHWLRNVLHYFPDSSLRFLHLLVRQIYSLAPEPGLSTWIVKEAAAGSSTSQNSSPLVGTTRAAGNGEASPSSNTSCK